MQSWRHSSFRDWGDKDLTQPASVMHWLWTLRKLCLPATYTISSAQHSVVALVHLYSPFAGSSPLSCRASTAPNWRI